MPEIDIGGTIIDIPNTGAQPIWSEPVIAGFEATAEALSGLVGAGDISRQEFTLNNSHNPGTDIVLTGLSFNPTLVRGAFMNYKVTRNTTSPTSTIVEVGNMNIIYNGENSSGLKWECQREYVGDAQITFSVQDDGQFLFTTAAIGGVTHTGTIAFTATALLQ